MPTDQQLVALERKVARLEAMVRQLQGKTVVLAERADALEVEVRTLKGGA